MIIRDATERDWPQVYPFFCDIVAAGETYAYPDGLSEEEAAALWMEKPPSRTVVAVDGDRVFGSAKMGPNRPGRGSHIATGSFMVDPSAAGRSVGRALGLHLIEWARREGYHGIQFNAVVATNERAMHLWRSLGFRLVGTVPGAFEHATQGRVGLNILYRDV